jgi:Cof subfamily protein (haloacid dehalogenase superfamily)
MKIIFLDLDGTLLNDEREITQGNRDALKKALDLGHRVVITTGRPLASAKIQNAHLGLTGQGCYIIAYNGGLIYDCGAEKAIYENYLPTDVAIKAVRLCNGMDIHAQTYDDTHILVEPNHHPDAVKKYSNFSGLPYRQVDSFDETLGSGVPKVLVISYGDRPKLELAGKVLKAALAGEADCFFSSKSFMEVVKPGLNKGTAMTRLCDMLHIPIEDSIACGDQENDVVMLKTAGLGVAMQNAIDAAKEAADYVTENDNNHDAIAEVVEKFILNV